MSDVFGDRMKQHEAITSTLRLDVHLPIYARIDGRCFSKWTRGLNRPFDSRLSQMMVETTAYLVEQTGATLGYTQSDEISLGWRACEEGSSLFFDGKLLKMASVLAGMASAHLAVEAHYHWPEKPLPCFDCRVFNVPNEVELTNAFLWREQDCEKNALIGVCSQHYSHKQMHGKHGGNQMEMLAEKGVDFESYPLFFRRGTYLKRVVESRALTALERERIPAKHRPAPDALFQRSRVDGMEWHLGGRTLDERLQALR